MTISIKDLQGLGDSGTVVTDRGDKVGAVGQIYVDNDNNTPTWVTVKTGLLGGGESFVPLQGARVDRGNVVVSYDVDTIKSAPRVSDDGEVTPDEEGDLYRHYGMSASGGYTTDRTDTAGPTADRRDSGHVPSDLDDPSEAGDHRPDISHRTVGHDTSGPTTDDAMTLSEERLHVGTQTREAGRARLRKYVTTEHVSQTVPLRHEEVRLQREPITDANRGTTSGPTIGEETFEVVLHEEVPVVAKEAVAVERVRLDTRTVVEQQTVSADVRKEEIELESPGQS